MASVAVEQARHRWLRIFGLAHQSYDPPERGVVADCGQLDMKKVQTSCIRLFEQRGVHSWPPQIEIPLAWRVELASLAVAQGLPFSTSDEIIAAFMRIYEGVVQA